MVLTRFEYSEPVAAALAAIPLSGRCPAGTIKAVRTRARRIPAA